VRLTLAAVIFFGACTLRPPVQHAVTIDMTATPDRATVSATTEIADAFAERAEMAARLDTLRRETAAGRDEWATRFGVVDKVWERVTFESRGGTLERVERAATIARPDLQRLFADTGLVFQGTRGNGWYELSIYAASSNRASRQERERVMTLLDEWCSAAAKYLSAIAELYSYLDEQPHRAAAAFGVLLEEEKVTLSDEERQRIDRVTVSSEAIIKLMEAAEQRGVTLDEQFDAVFNPFPATLTLRTPRVMSQEGFRARGDTLVVERAGLLDAVLALENRWISPDPMAIALRAEVERTKVAPAAEIALLPRKASRTVTTSEIRAAVLERLRPSALYRVRFAEQ
jgi:hypothetical protein